MAGEEHQNRRANCTDVNGRLGLPNLQAGRIFLTCRPEGAGDRILMAQSKPSSDLAILPQLLSVEVRAAYRRSYRELLLPRSTSQQFRGSSFVTEGTRTKGQSKSLGELRFGAPRLRKCFA
jgi:hypothetical protein